MLTTLPTAPASRVAAFLLALIVVFGGSTSGLLIDTLTASPAEAQTLSSRIQTRAELRLCSYTGSSEPGCAPHYAFETGTRVQMICWEDNSTVGGTPRWFWVVDGRGIEGYVSASTVADSTQTAVDHCNNHPGVAALRWAAYRIGHTVPTEAEKSNNPSMDRWSGWCYVLAYDAHALGTGRAPLSGHGTARNTFYEYQRRGLISTGADIPVGAIVFWPNVTSAGHAAVADGNGWVVSTQGNGSHQPNYRTPASTFGAPAGWVHPNNVTGTATSGGTQPPPPARSTVTLSNPTGLHGPSQYISHANAGHGNSLYYTTTIQDGRSAVNWATWQRTLPAGNYRVEVYIPSTHGYAQARYSARLDGVQNYATVMINQRNHSNQWVPLMNTHSNGTSQTTVWLADPSPSAYNTQIVWDALRFVPI